MKLSSDNETLAENKVLILYILNKVNKPLSNNALLKLVISITDMNYFYFQQFLLDLIENKYIVTYEVDGEILYKITDEGKEALELTQDIIPGIIKFRIDSNFKENLDIIKDEFSITADFIPQSEKEYSVKCKLVENSKTLFEIQVFAGSHEQAKIITENWKNNASTIYPKLLEILYGKQ